MGYANCQRGWKIGGGNVGGQKDQAKYIFSCFHLFTVWRDGRVTKISSVLKLVKGRGHLL